MCRATEDLSDLGVGEILPCGKPEHFSIVITEAIHGIEHVPRLGVANDDRGRIGLGIGSLLGEFVVQSPRASLRSALIRKRLANNSVDPRAGIVTGRHGIDASPNDKERFGEGIESVLRGGAAPEVGVDLEVMGAIQSPESLIRRDSPEGGFSGHSLSTCPHGQCSSQGFFPIDAEVPRNVVIPVGVPDREGGRKGDEMKRFTIILLAVATALVMALPATAKKPVKPDPEPEPAMTYTAEITFTSDDGISTTCDASIPVVRTDESRGAVSHFESTGAELNVQAAELAFEGVGVSGCLGSHVYPEYFRVTLDGDQVAMLWIFDVEFDANGDYRTDFRMGGPYAEVVNPKNGKTTIDFAKWTECPDGTFNDGDTCLEAAGTFIFVRYEAGGDPMFTDLENGSQEFALRINLTPIP
jgi:hypothetical protein